MEAKHTCVDRFKNNLVTFLDIISEMCDDGREKGVVNDNFSFLPLLKIFINTTFKEYMLENFITRTHEHWTKIREKDIEYFKTMGLELFDFVGSGKMEKYKEGNSLLQKLSTSQIENFKKLLETSYQVDGVKYYILDDERQGDIWKILHSFVRISLIYIHEKRQYINGAYTVEFFPEISVKSNAQLWNVKSIKF